MDSDTDADRINQEIVIQEKSLPFPKYLSQDMYDRKIVELVDGTLSRHSGPIHCFELSTQLESCAHFDRWINILSRKGIKRLTLNKWRGDIIFLSSCFFACVDLTYLELYRCAFFLPASFQGFSRLTKLNLQCICVPGDDCLHQLLSACPLLEDLTLMDIVGCHSLEISAPKLECLQICGPFKDVQLKSVPFLDFVSLNVSLSNSSHAAQRIGNILDHVPNIEELELLHCTLKNLAVGEIPDRLSGACPVKYLLIHVNFEDLEEMQAAFCIFRSSNAMEELEIKAISNEENARILVDDDCFWEAEEKLNCTFSHLRTVKVTDFLGISSELKFVEFILANSPVLEKLCIAFHKDAEDVPETVMELLRFCRVSNKAEVSVSTAPRIQSSVSNNAYTILNKFRGLYIMLNKFRRLWTRAMSQI